MAQRMLPILFLTLNICAYSQPQYFKITKTRTYIKSTGKTVWDSTKSGRAYINFALAEISFNYGDKWVDFSFNNIQSFGSNDSVLSCTFRYFQLPKKSESVEIYLEGTENHRMWWRITHYQNNSIITYYLARVVADEEFTDFTIVDYIKRSLENLQFDWEYVASSSDGILWFVRSEPLKSDKIIEVWIKQLHPTFKYKNVTYTNAESKIIMKFDCTDRQLYTAEQYYYNNKGNIITSEPDYGEGWQRVIPESVGELVLDKICQMFKK